MGLIRIIRRVGILNIILFFVAFFGITMCVGVFIFMPDSNIPTASDIADSRKTPVSFETLTEKQLQEGTMVEGSIRFNMDDFARSPDDREGNYTHYAILLNDKVMSIAVYDVRDSSSLEHQENEYLREFHRNNLSIWQYHDEENSAKDKKKKSKKNKKTVKEVIQETMEHEIGVSFKGKIVKMDPDTETALRNYVIPEGETEPAFEVLPYEIKFVRPVNLGELILTYGLTVLAGIVGVAAFFILVLRIRFHKTFP
ncbi:MAG: hypothetical protein K2K70_10060 [Lachnospiraceae bacterium]|nr:hypothetical protein [Lachnospiraceae bacterium]